MRRLSTQEPTESHSNSAPAREARRPVILVSITTTDGHAQYWSRVFAHPLYAAGALPFLFPLLEDAAARREALQMADGILLGGGGDVAPELYGEQPHELVRDIDHSRDELELNLVREAIEMSLPVVGTCRGIQVINVALGGSLYMDHVLHPGAEQHVSGGSEGFEELIQLELARDERVADAARHWVEIAPGTMLERLFGRRLLVNSFHHQHVRRLGENVVVAAHSEDGVVEAIEVEGTKAPVIGVQWEMQEGWRRDPEHFGLFEFLVEEARRRET